MPCDRRVAARYSIDDSQIEIQMTVESDHKGSYTARVKGPRKTYAEKSFTDPEKAIRWGVNRMIEAHTSHMRNYDEPSDITWGHVHIDGTTVYIECNEKGKVRLSTVAPPPEVYIDQHKPPEIGIDPTTGKIERKIPVIQLEGGGSTTSSAPTLDTPKVEVAEPRDVDGTPFFKPSSPVPPAVTELEDREWV